MTTPTLTPLEARVLGVLVEKEQTVPDTYPLTLNALTAGCNQKTSREPIMSATEAQVQDALDGLRRRSLVIESSGGRVMRYAQNAKRVLELPSASVALLMTLVLRGPQTAAELRANAERLHRFADGSSVEAFLQELAERPAGALVVLLARQPGTREARWAHLLCGPVVAPIAAPIAAPVAASVTAAAAAAMPSDGAADAAPPAGTDTSAMRLERLEAEVARLDARLERLCRELGIEP
ncbi:MAG: YceH family protein [Lautropia sp.]